MTNDQKEAVIAEQVVAEVMACMGKGKEGELIFVEEPEFLLARIGAMRDEGLRQAVVSRLVEFGNFLRIEKKSDESCRALMSRLQSVVGRLGHGSLDTFQVK